MDAVRAPEGNSALCEEIAELARGYLENSRCDGEYEIEQHISLAMAEARWDDVSKWHRVRLRLQRFRQQRYVTAQLLSPRDSRSLG